MSEDNCLTWDYDTLEVIAAASQVHIVSVRRSVIALAKVLGFKFKGIRRQKE